MIKKVKLTEKKKNIRTARSKQTARFLIIQNFPLPISYSANDFFLLTLEVIDSAVVGITNCTTNLFRTLGSQNKSIDDNLCQTFDKRTSFD